jgi:hypothetical protein
MRRPSEANLAEKLDKLLRKLAKSGILTTDLQITLRKVLTLSDAYCYDLM